MFVTLRQNEKSLSIERKDFAPSHQACENCRAKKLRCSGQRNGCHGCVTKGLPCEYPLLVERRGHKRRRMTNKATPDTSSSDGRNIISGTLKSARLPLTPFLQSSLQDSSSRSIPQSTWNDLGVTGIPDAASILDPETHASADSELFCDFITPYAPTAQLDRLSVDDMCTSISAVASDVRLGGSASCVPFEPAGARPWAAQSLPSIEDRSTTKSCQCVLIMLSLLEDAETEGERLCLGMIDHFLRLNKHGLAKCHRVLDCGNCCSNSKLVMLIITICRAMASQHERMYKILVHQYEKLQGLGRKTGIILRGGEQGHVAEPASEARNAPVATMGILALNDYEVDAFEEPCVFGGLATMQQRAWLKFMAELRQLCDESDWQIHVKILVGLELRVKAQLERMRTYHEKNEG